MERSNEYKDKTPSGYEQGFVLNSCLNGLGKEIKAESVMEELLSICLFGFMRLFKVFTQNLYYIFINNR